MSGEAENTEANDITPNISIVLGKIYQNYQVARNINSCPHPNGECAGDIIEYEGGIINCPIFASVKTPEDTRKCSYSRRLLEKFHKHVKDALIEIGVPRRHVAAFGKIRNDKGFTEATSCDLKDFIILCGPTGTGKSFAAAYLCYKYILSKFEWAFVDKSKWGEVSRAAEDRIGWYIAYELATMSAKEQKEVASTCDILVIDDLGIEDNTAHAAAAINYIISKRYDRGSDSATIITSNLALDDIKQRYGKRFADRMTESGKVVIYKK
jgi:hypothetical protein